MPREIKKDGESQPPQTDDIVVFDAAMKEAAKIIDNIEHQTRVKPEIQPKEKLPSSQETPNKNDA